MRRSLLAVALALAAGGTADAQGSRADYERAEGLRGKFSGLLERFALEPQWAVPDGSMWFRVGGVAGDEIVHVDLETGERTELLGGSVVGRFLELADPDVELERFAIVDDEYLFWRRGESIVWATESLETAPTSRAISEQPAFLAWEEQGGARSRSDGGGSSVLVLFNESAGPVSLIWIDAGGVPRSYGTIATGESRRQTTFERHVWELRDEEERVLGRFSTWMGTSAAVVDGAGELAVMPVSVVDPFLEGSEPDDAPSPTYGLELRSGRLEVVDLESHAVTRLDHGGDEDTGFRHRPVWSPDARVAAVVLSEPLETRRIPLVDVAPDGQVQPTLDRVPYRKPGDPLPELRIAVVHPEDGRLVACDSALIPNPYSLGRPQWLPDSDEFTVTYNERGHQAYRLVAFDAETGAGRVVAEETPETFVDYTNKTYSAISPDGSTLVWMSERSGWNHLYRIDVATGEVRNPITSGEWVVRGVEELDWEAGEVLIRCCGIHPDQDPYHVHWARAKLDGSELVVLTEGDGTHTLEWGPGRSHYLDRYSRVDLPTVTELRRASDGSLVAELGRDDDTALREAGWSPPRRFVAKGRDGETDIWGILHFPTNFDPDRSYPVIENIYAGPHGAHVPKSFSIHSHQREIAELGFVVVQIDGMGTNWRSKAFHDVCWRNLGDAGFPDRRRWIEAAAEAYPQLDLSRVGIYGGSAGGQNSLGALLTHGDFYHVAVSDCGCHDNRMDKIWWNEQWMGWPIGPHYAEQSNVTLAPNLEGELLLCVGALDRNVDPASTMQVVDALIAADKDFDLLVMPSAGHGAIESPYGRRRRQDFFVEHLLDVEPRRE